MHFFNPATVMKLVEVISTQRTATDVKTAADAFASDVLGKRVVHCKDRAGFVVNMLLVPYLCQAMRMFE
ncbi:MAG TPA: 3-hydroxybutyryl-CoA dehydrogenase, partial [Acidimicrobiaceae bacterium]|nr:3-hydroxybutyryl-CoA dehydrogenase [Acidimicrobiaceae bacterium]